LRTNHEHESDRKMKINKNTKEGRKQLLDLFIERCSLPVVDKTNFAKGSKVHGGNEEIGFTVAVSQAYGVAVNFAGYGWQTKATADQQEYLRKLAAEVNDATEFDDLTPQEGPYAP
jgi:hypothetical protein